MPQKCTFVGDLLGKIERLFSHLWESFVEGYSFVSLLLRVVPCQKEFSIGPDRIISMFVKGLTFLLRQEERNEPPIVGNKSKRLLNPKGMSSVVLWSLASTLHSSLLLSKRASSSTREGKLPVMIMMMMMMMV